jgi:hypothetical protein
MVDYDVIGPNEIFRGKTYSSLVSDWVNWFFSADADSRTSGPVVFVRSHGLPRSHSTADLEADDESPSKVNDPNYPKKYKNIPNIRIGSDRLQIYEDQTLFVPIIVSIYVGAEQYADLGYMQDWTGLTIDYGDNPPGKDQLTVDNVPIKLPPGTEIEDFRISTSIFTVVVPDSEYGRSIKDFLETSVPPGNYPAMADGYFVLLRFKPGDYIVHSWASAPREAHGPYFSRLMYEVEVFPRKKPIGVVTSFKPAENLAEITRILYEKTKRGELSSKNLAKVKSILGV